jgi:hypothetical protein
VDVLSSSTNAPTSGRTGRAGDEERRQYDFGTKLEIVLRHVEGESGFSKERRPEPQITVGLLTDAAGFPLMVNAFEGNKAETHHDAPGEKREP